MKIYNMLRSRILRLASPCSVASRFSVASRCYSVDRLQQYREKLQAKAEALGLENVDALKTQLKDEIELKKKELNKMDPLKELEEYERRQAEEAAKDGKEIKVRGPRSKETPELPYKRLQSYLDVDKAAALGKQELEFLWRARFHGKERTLLAILDSVQFSTIYANAFKNPSFILPLPRNNEGHEMHFVQWSFVGPYTTHCMLTTVAEYKLHKEYAKPHTTLMFHQDLAEKGVVLMNGLVEEEASLKMDEAQLLLLNIQRFYGAISKDKEANERRLQLLRGFTSGDQEFDMQKLIDEATSFE